MASDNNDRFFKPIIIALVLAFLGYYLLHNPKAKTPDSISTSTARLDNRSAEETAPQAHEVRASNLSQDSPPVTHATLNSPTPPPDTSPPSFSQEAAKDSEQGMNQSPKNLSPRIDVYGKPLRGLKDGHFDIETSTRVYPLKQGETDYHSHEYDDKHDVTFADYFHLLDHKLSNINAAVPADTRFVLIVANAQLSKGGIISINGESMPVMDYQKRVAKFISGDRKAIKIYSLDGKSGEKLSALKIGFSPETFLNGGLTQSAPTCVLRNEPGKQGEYRNGALLIQAIAIDNFKIDPITSSASIDSGLLWESSLFWHRSESCYR